MSSPRPPAPEQAFFEESFLAELEQLAAGDGALRPAGAEASLHGKLVTFLEPADAETLDEERFVGLPSGRFAERTGLLLEICRGGLHTGAVQAVENFIVFFQALLPGLEEDGAHQVKRFFFRLAPTLIQIAYHDFGEREDALAEGRAALSNLETILIEISDVRLAPGESELVFRSLDQLACFIAAGEFTVASRIVSAQLLDIIARNKLARALYRLMEAEVAVQRRLQELLGYATPRIRVPEDLPALSEYGAIRVLREEAFGAEPRLMIQLQLPGIQRVSDVVLYLRGEGGEGDHALRLDALGAAPLGGVPRGSYHLGLAYEPPRAARARPALPQR